MEGTTGTVPPTPLPDAIAGGMQRLSTYADVDEALRSPLLLQVAHPRAAKLARGTRVDFPLAGAVQSLDGPAHLERRRAYAPVLRRALLATYEFEHLVPTLRRHLKQLSALAAHAEVRADLVPLMRSAALAVTAAIIGLDDTDDPAREQLLLDLSERLTEGGGVYWLSGDHDRVTLAALDARAQFMEVFGAPAVDRRRQAVDPLGPVGSPAEMPHDIISALVRGAGLDPSHELELVNELTFFVVASFNTPTKLVPHVVIELDGWASSHQGERDRLHDPVFVYAATQEALRLHVAAPILLRKASETVTLRSGTRISEGALIALDLGAANRDTRAFGHDADQFVPGRRHAPGVQPYGMAFGSGPHKCIGAPLTVAPDSPADVHAPAGIMVRFLLEFAAVGMRLDQDDPPRRRTDTVRDEYATCPVVFEALPAMAR